MTSPWLVVMLPLARAALANAGPPAPSSAPPPDPVTMPRAEHAPLVTAPAEADETARTAHNAVFAEAFGSGLLYSVNYERLFDALGGVGLRAGLSYFTYQVSSYGKSGNLSLVTVPLVASYYWGSPRHKLQIGLGTTLIYLDPSTDSEGTEFGGERSGFGVAGSGIVGYRYLPPRGGVTFGAAFTPLIRPGRALAWGGVNVGYAF